MRGSAFNYAEYLLEQRSVVDRSLAETTYITVRSIGEEGNDEVAMEGVRNFRRDEEGVQRCGRFKQASGLVYHSDGGQGRAG